MPNLEIPADVVAHAGNLLPRRAQLVRYLEWREREERALADAEANRDRLVRELADCQATLTAVAKTVTADTGGLIDRIKSCSAWSLSSLSGKKRADLEAQRVIAAHRLEVGRRALDALQNDLAERQERVAAIAGQAGAFVVAALLEHAEAEYGPRYQRALDELYDVAAALEAVESLAGRGHDGRLVIDVPGFRSAGQAHDVEPLVFLPTALRRAGAVWRKLADAWSRDPHADPSQHLQFAPRDPKEVDDTPYENRSDSERHVIDAAYANVTPFEKKIRMTQTLNISAALELPEMRACASTLRLAGVKITAPMTAAEVDAALRGKDIPTRKRIEIKSAMHHAGLLKN